MTYLAVLQLDGPDRQAGVVFIPTLTFDTQCSSTTIFERLGSDCCSRMNLKKINSEKKSVLFLKKIEQN